MKSKIELEQEYRLLDMQIQCERLISNKNVNECNNYLKYCLNKKKQILHLINNISIYK